MPTAVLFFIKFKPLFNSKKLNIIYFLGIPIAHLHGGETTQAALDEGFRHSITKMSHLHFTATNEYKKRLLKQAARELLLAQSSDWSFILKAGTTTQLAKERINRHLERFWDLIKAIKSTKNITQNYLTMIEKEDCLFPNINPYDWSN